MNIHTGNRTLETQSRVKPFMGEDFLLESETARNLYHGYAQRAPVYDFHNHIAPKDIAMRRRFDNLTELWLQSDHYKWRAMRALGIDESFITGSAGDYEKFFAYASALPRLVGNPVYHWTHLELKRYFGIDEPLSPQTCAVIWDKTREALSDGCIDAAGLVEMMNVKLMCTADDPADTLEWHAKIRADDSMRFKVLPSFRPDAYLDCGAPGWRENIARLGARFNTEIRSFSGLMDALLKALDFFCRNGCRVADHGLSAFDYRAGDANAAFDSPERSENALTLRSALLSELARAYCERDILMQLHIGAIRNNSARLMRAIGPDAGGDSVGKTTDPVELGRFLAGLEEAGKLPKTILYNSNPADNAVFSTMAANFSPMVQYGAAWWFNDHIAGIGAQIDELMLTGLLARNMGMVTDSRSLTSFVRHEYFRRILSNKLASLVDKREYPGDMTALGSIVEDVCYKNAAAFFEG